MVAAIVPGQLLTLSNVWDALVVGNEDLHVVPVLVEHGRLIQVFIRRSHEGTYELMSTARRGCPRKTKASSYIYSPLSIS